MQHNLAVLFLSNILQHEAMILGQLYSQNINFTRKTIYSFSYQTYSIEIKGFWEVKKKFTCP